MHVGTDTTDTLTLERELKLKNLLTTVSSFADSLRCVSNVSVVCQEWCQWFVSKLG